MGSFLKYLRARCRYLHVYVMLIGIYSSAYFLFDVKPIVVLYPLILSLIVMFVAVVTGYIMMSDRRNKIMREEYPDTCDPVEEDYQNIINRLNEDMEDLKKCSAEDYNNMIEYYTVWAHQIKTPIAAMRLNLQFEDTESARRMSGDLNRIEAYVDMVLTYLRLDSESTDYVIKEYELDDIIRHSVKKFSREFIVKKLKLDYEPTGYKVLTDEKWLAFIIEQVISNAVKYTQEGGIRIYMDTPGVLAIEDTGIGISASDLPRIFDKGYTGFNGRKDKEASGIGLYLCKRVADNLGHTLSAKSDPGSGTTITVDLTRHKIGIE